MAWIYNIRDTTSIMFGKCCCFFQFVSLSNCGFVALEQSLCLCVEVEGGLIEHWSGTADIIWEEVLMARLSPLLWRTKRRVRKWPSGRHGLPVSRTVHKSGREKKNLSATFNLFVSQTLSHCGVPAQIFLQRAALVFFLSHSSPNS